MTPNPIEKVTRVFAVLLWALVAAACGSSGDADRRTTSDLGSPEAADGQVIVFDTELADYLEATTLSADVVEHHQTSLAAPVTNTCIEEGEYSELATSLVATPIIDTAAAAQALDSLDSDVVHDTLTDELQRLQRALPGPPVTVCVVIVGDDTAAFVAAEMNGVTGVTAGTGRVILLIDPLTFSDEALRYTLAHEYHHSWWTSHQPAQPTFTVLDYLLFEGRADSFASLQHPDYTAPWTTALTGQEIVDQWVAIEPNLGSGDPALLQAVMFGGGTFPQWTGYATGHRIVQEFLAANPTATPDQWGLMSSAELLARSGFGTP